MMKKTFFIMIIGLISAISPISSYGQKKKAKAKESAPVTYVDTLTARMPELKDGGDSIAFFFGTMQSSGLREYIQKQLGVDTAYIKDFCRGMLDRVAVNHDDKKALAYDQGIYLGTQVENMVKSMSKDYYEADSTKSVDANIVARAIVASVLGKSTWRTQDAGEAFNKSMEARKAQNKEIIYAPNRIAGEKWLEENKKKPGVITLPSGLQYKIITKGEGEIPNAKDKATVHYEGHLIDGTVFDSSLKRTKPSTFQCNQVIKGWTEALTMMPVGSKWEIYLPYDLAYGTNDTGNIKPYSALIFTVELLSIERATEKSAKSPIVTRKSK